MEGPQSNTRGERLFYEIEQFLLDNGAYQFLHLFLRRVKDRITNGEITVILAPLDVALERLARAAGKTIDQIRLSPEGLNILANHVSSAPINLTGDGKPIYVAINGTPFGKQTDDLNLLNYTKFAQFETVMVETINRVISGPGQLDKLKGLNLQLTKQEKMTTNSRYDKLHSDIIRKIALELSLSNVLSNCLTSKIFNKVICKNEAFWHEKLRKDNPNQHTMIGSSWKITYEALNGRLFISGNKNYSINFRSQSGSSYNKNQIDLIPTRIPYINQVTAVATGQYHVALISNGQLYTFGYNTHGQLGLDDIKAVENPTKVTIPKSNYVITAVACGANHTAIISNHQVYTFGMGVNGQLGLGDYNNCDVPTMITEFDNVSLVACYHLRTVIISGKRLYTFGTSNSFDINIQGYNIPTLFPDLDEITTVDISLDTTTFVSRGKLYPYSGRFNERNDEGTVIPTIIDKSGIYNISRIACGYRYALAIADEQLYSIGFNSHGQLGLGDYDNRTILTLVPGLNNVTHAACGLQHSAVIADGKLYTFGINHDGRLGTGVPPAPLDIHGMADIIDRVNIPVLVDEFERVLTVACGDQRTCIVGVADPNSKVNLTTSEYRNQLE